MMSRKFFSTLITGKSKTLKDLWRRENRPLTRQKIWILIKTKMSSFAGFMGSQRIHPEHRIEVSPTGKTREQ